MTDNERNAFIAKVQEILAREYELARPDDLAFLRLTLPDTAERIVDASSLDTAAVTRIEVISDDGRVFVLSAASDVKLSLQDDGRTLKVFCQGRS